jgi:type IV pilus assembly protein PilQ
MNLNFTRSIVQTDASGQATPATRNITTDVIVDSGNTLVLGGVQSISETEASAGVPFLRKIPIIGWLFGKETLGQEKTELMFFVTPRILNMKRAGLSEASVSAEEGKKTTL